MQQGVGSILPLIARTLSLDHEHVGFVVAAVSAGSATFAALGGVAVDYLGERTVILWSGIAMGAALCTAAIAPNLTWLVAWMFLFGMAYGTSLPAGGRAILLWFKAGRGLAMGVRQTGVPLGGFIGSLVLPILALRWGYQAALLVAGAVCVLVTLIGMHQYRSPIDQSDSERQTVKEVLYGMLRVTSTPKSIFVNLTGSALVSVQFTALAFLALGVIALKGASLTIAAETMAAFQAGAIVGRLLWGTVSDRVFKGDRIAPMQLMSVIACFGLLWLSKPGYESPVIVMASAGVLGISAAAWNGLFATVQAEIGGHRLAGSAVGAGVTIVYIVGAIVPPVFGALVDRTNFSIAWQALAVIAALGIIPSVFARRLLYGSQPAVTAA
jgi:sugar phosphate permease